MLRKSIYTLLTVLLCFYMSISFSACGDNTSDYFLPGDNDWQNITFSDYTNDLPFSEFTNIGWDKRYGDEGTMYCTAYQFVSDLGAEFTVPEYLTDTEGRNIQIFNMTVIVDEESEENAGEIVPAGRVLFPGSTGTVSMTDYYSLDTEKDNKSMGIVYFYTRFDPLNTESADS